MTARSAAGPEDAGDQPRWRAGFKRSSPRARPLVLELHGGARGRDPVGVLLGAKRPRRRWSTASRVHPEHRRRGHGRHLLTSLGPKLAILGPPRIVAEVPGRARAAGCSRSALPRGAADRLRPAEDEARCARACRSVRPAAPDALRAAAAEVSSKGVTPSPTISTAGSDPDLGRRPGRQWPDGETGQFCWHALGRDAPRQEGRLAGLAAASGANRGLPALRPGGGGHARDRVAAHVRRGRRRPSRATDRATARHGMPDSPVPRGARRRSRRTFWRARLPPGRRASSLRRDGTAA